MRKIFLKYEEMRKYFTIYEEAFRHIWLFFLMWGKFNFLFYQCTVTLVFSGSLTHQTGRCTATSLSFRSFTGSTGCLSLRLHKMYLAFQSQSIYIVEHRAVSGVFQNIDPPPPLHPVSVSSPRPAPKAGGVHTRRAVRGWGVNILEDARHWIGLLQFNPYTVSTDSEIDSYTESTGLLYVC